MKKELTSKRNRNEKHFDNGDGTFSAIFTHEPMHYKRGGKWVDSAEFSLVESGGYIRGDSDEFGVRVKDFKISVGSSNFTIEGLAIDGIVIEQPSGSPIIESPTSVLYQDIFTGIDIRYDIDAYSVRENIIFKRNPFAGTLVNGKRIGVQMKVVGELPNTVEPFGFDALGRSLPVAADKTIPLASLQRAAYPLVIDPTTAFQPHYNRMFYTISTQPGNVLDGGSTYIYAGAYTSKDGDGVYRSYMRFQLNTLAGYSVTSATFSATNAQAKSLTLRALSNYNESATYADHYAAIGAGTSLGSSSSTSLSFSCTSHVSAYVGGYCFFGATGVETPSTSNLVVLTSVSLSVTYETSSGTDATVALTAGSSTATGLAYSALTDGIPSYGAASSAAAGGVFNAVADMVGAYETAQAGATGLEYGTFADAVVEFADAALDATGATFDAIADNILVFSAGESDAAGSQFNMSAESVVEFVSGALTASGGSYEFRQHQSLLFANEASQASGNEFSLSTDAIPVISVGSASAAGMTYSAITDAIAGFINGSASALGNGFDIDAECIAVVNTIRRLIADETISLDTVRVIGVVWDYEDGGATIVWNTDVVSDGNSWQTASVASDEWSETE